MHQILSASFALRVRERERETDRERERERERKREEAGIFVTLLSFFTLLNQKLSRGKLSQAKSPK